MAVSAFIRCSYFRRLVGISNNAVILFLDSAWYSNYIKSQSYTTSISEIKRTVKTNMKKPEKKISKAMLMYLQRAKEHDEFMRKEILEYEIGKRHLANMMGEDPECFTQADIDSSIQYLFPSGLFDPKARPIMEHPEKIFPSRKAAEFDESGRPFHSMFYTSKPNYYELLYNIVDNIKSLNDIEDSLIKQETLPMDKVDLGSSWLSKNEIEKQLLENINDFEYNYLITSLEQLCDHPLSRCVTDFILKYRKTLNAYSKDIIVLPLEHDSSGRPYVTVKNCMRKSARGEVTIWGNGSGKIVINGRDITYFEDIQHREQRHQRPFSSCGNHVCTTFISRGSEAAIVASTYHASTC
ncbi:PREDICTED: 28S ribosomal protein S9, mitochondrial [Cyphomyrmex costatus]|uniref:28S ribosomal protein S9, mitochondrial n=1 Tax=Cyphomyrmex costatus TaxID=456900 RepID=UPI00085229C6|nr:PREDICTED: 28S ribosomal protein S9, mitochondrial [Cyphomyrmex costatus]